MPGLDKTGPMGQGAQTGRKMGKCKTGNETQIDDLTDFPGRGLRQGRGKGFRVGNGINTPGMGRGPGRRRGNRT
jgi:hypothetical protein